jgi:glucose-6-phosphate 1-dehydrogenase
MKMPDNLVLIIFGASGDLAFRKLIPAIYSLKVQNLLPANFEVIGIGRSVISDEDFRGKLKKGIISFSGETNLGDNLLDLFTEHISYL